MAFGATVELEYEIFEEGVGDDRLWVTLESGDAFVANSKVQNLRYRVVKTTSNHA